MRNVATLDDAHRCAIDTVELARIRRLLDETPPADIARLFSARELEDAGSGEGRVYSIQVSCADAAGNEASGVTTVLVPRTAPKSPSETSKNRKKI